MTKKQLARMLDRNGIGNGAVIYGYNEEGFCGSWLIRRLSQVDQLPSDILFSFYDFAR